MGYAPSMSSGFIYHPHVHQSDGTVVTPDIAITRIFASGPDRLAPVPVSRLTSAAVIQQTADAPVGAPAVVLVAASYGMLVSVGCILADAVAIARAAWRYDDIAAVYDAIMLRSWTVRDGKRTAFVSENLSGLMSPADAMGALGNTSGLKPGTAVSIGHPARLGESLAADRFEVALDAEKRSLIYGYDIDGIG
jgi:hypothetical protein